MPARPPARLPARLPARRLPVAAAAAVLLMVPFAGVAFAHVEAESDGAAGGSGTVTFTVPTEKDVPTTKVEIAFPVDTPLVGIAPEPVDGWTSALTTAPPAAPITGPDGQPVTELVTRVTWTATAGGIPPEESGEFAVAVGRFPDADSVEFKALQTYGDGSVVSWIEEQPEGAPEPEHPAPVLDLAGGASMSAEPDGSTVAPSVEAAAPTAAAEPAAAPEPPPSGGAGNAVSAVVIGLIGVGLAAGAVAAGRRRSSR